MNAWRFYEIWKEGVPLRATGAGGLGGVPGVGDVLVLLRVWCVARVLLALGLGVSMKRTAHYGMAPATLGWW